MRVVADRCDVLITVGVADGETKRPRQDRDVCNDKPDGDARRRYPSDLSDTGWAVLQPLMPVREARKGGAYLSRSPPKCPNVPTSPAAASTAPTASSLSWSSHPTRFGFRKTMRLSRLLSINLSKRGASLTGRFKGSRVDQEPDPQAPGFARRLVRIGGSAEQTHDEAPVASQLRGLLSFRCRRYIPAVAKACSIPLDLF
jgi:hypothetical protein